jgi:hypothetical protein
MRLCFAASNLCIEEPTASNGDSRENTIDLTGDDGDDSDDGDSGDDNGLPALEDLFSHAMAMRRMAMSEPDQIFTHSERLVYNASLKSGLRVGDRGATQNFGADAHVSGSSGKSQGEHTKSLIFLSLAGGLLLT